MRNFHKHQDQAFARTAKLIVWLILAAAGTVMVTGAVLTYLFVLMLTCLQLNPIDFQLQLFEIFLLICLVTAMLLAASSWHKMKQLREGGKVIALDLGGQLIEARTSNRYERRVLNVVEEMAVSAGISVPAVYVLPNQPGINAFAAGLTFDDAVIGVTQGCIRTSEPRPAPGSDCPRIQPHSQWRHASQPASWWASCTACWGSRCLPRP